MLSHVRATRYVTPLREGGSLPGLVEADDLGTYVVKFHGAGQGRKTLVAEVVTGELARALGLPVPRLVTVDVDPGLAPGEPDEEVQDLLRASPGLNLGMDFLPGSLDLDAAWVDPATAGRVLFLDALVGNVDRSWRNPNMLLWHREPWLIDHGATLTFHHHWPGADRFPTRPYDAREHLLLGRSPELTAAEAELAPRVTEELLTEVVAQVPQGWLADEPGFVDVDAVRAAYVRLLGARVAAREQWMPGVLEAVADAPAQRTPPEIGRARPGWLGPAQ